jgi:hypothetical protein
MTQPTDETRPRRFGPLRLEKPARVQSPCVNVCVMDEDSGYCFGCKRTLDEIADWSAASDPDRLRILSALEDRTVPELPEPR